MKNELLENRIDTARKDRIGDDEVLAQYTALARELLAEALYKTRSRQTLTQERMAEQLRISSRAYSDLERRKSSPSMLTMLFLFSMMDAETQQTLIARFSEGIHAIDEAEFR